MNHTTSPRARVAPEIFTRHPDYRAGIVYARNVVNGPSDERSLAMLRAAEEVARARFADRAPSEDPHLAAWRSAYAAFGAKPSKFLSSAEALLKRTLKGGAPAINRLVDVYNAVSIAHVVPVGGEDADRVVGDPVVRFAIGGEPFETREGGEPVTVAVEPGEAVWADEAGVTCRRWNWRQCARTALTEDVVNAYFVLDVLAPYGDAQLEAATAALVDGLRAVSPDCEIEVETLRREGHRFE
jgi:DNA/RNA-binding domain of Phe-tRNA-synthetase-like protein